VFLQEGDHVHFADPKLKSYSFQDIPALTSPTTLPPRKRVRQETYSAATHYLLAAVVGCLKVHRLKWLIPSASCEVYLIIQESGVLTNTLKNLQFALPLIATTQIWSLVLPQLQPLAGSEATVPSMLSLEAHEPFCAGTSPHYNQL